MRYKEYDYYWYAGWLPFAHTRALCISLHQGGAIHDEFCGLSRLTGLQSLSFLVVGPLPAEVLAWGALAQLTQLEVRARAWAWAGACVFIGCG